MNLKEAKGANSKDKLVFFCIKNVYLSIAVVYKMVLGRKRQYQLYSHRRTTSKDIALLIEIHGKDNYHPVIDFLNSYNLNVIFQNDYDCGHSQLIARH
jgi:hypothetical protein